MNKNMIVSPLRSNVYVGSTYAESGWQRREETWGDSADSCDKFMEWAGLIKWRLIK